MSRKRRLLLGLCCIWPLVYVVVFLLLPLAQGASLRAVWSGPHVPITADGVISFALEWATLCLISAMVIFCVLHVAQAKHVHESERLPWTLLLILANVLSLPVYWYVNVWRVMDHTNRDKLAPSVVDRDG